MTKQTQSRRIAAIALALLLVLSVFGPIGTVSAQPSVSVTQTADSTTVAPGEAVEFTATLIHAETNAPGLSVDLPENWEITQQSADGPATFSPSETAWVWLAGDEDGVDNEFTVTYTVSVPADADDGDYTITAEGSAIDPSDDSFIYDTAQTTITVQDEPDPEPEPADFQVSNLNVPASAVAGEEITVSADVTNEGDESGTQTVEFLVDEDSVDSQALTLDGDESESVSFQYDTDGLSTGDYDVTVATDDDSASATLTITDAPSEDPSGVEISLQPTDQTAVIGETVEYDLIASGLDDGGLGAYDATVSLGDTSVAAFGDANAHLDLNDEFANFVDATEVGESIRIEMAGFDDDGSSEQTIGTVTLTGAAAGTSDIAVGDVDVYDQSGTPYTDISTSAAMVTIEDLQIATFQLADLEAPETAARGDEISVSATVTNTGDLEGTQSISYEFDGEIVDSQDVTLDAAESTTVTFEFSTEDVDVGTYTHGIVSEDDDVSATITIGPPALEGFDNPPQDLNGDGLYEDINGDGEFDVGDAQALFAQRNSDVVQNNVAAFDFNGDGKVDVGDVQTLFNLALSG